MSLQWLVSSFLYCEILACRMISGFSLFYNKSARDTGDVTTRVPDTGETRATPVLYERHE